MKDAELERNADGTEGILEKWLSRYVIKEKTSEKTSEKARGGGAARGVLSFFVAAVFSVAEGVGGTLPFGIALISGSEKHTP